MGPPPGVWLGASCVGPSSTGTCPPWISPTASPRPPLSLARPSGWNTSGPSPNPQLRSRAHCKSPLCSCCSTVNRSPASRGCAWHRSTTPRASSP
ncbi:hypothetical protein ACFFX0_04830 [Citricoccus parietis]|uniref:Secreted protein n=1 Tax=Citricoccus parietis TaxID=592307 RepID=A0ABV5FV42_9MICC